MEWMWMKDSVLYNCSKNTSTKEIFQAVCDELGRYYAEKGKKYARSNHTIKWKGKHLKYQIKFNSSHYNLQGDYVCLGIVINIWALSTEGMERKGILYFVGKCETNDKMRWIDHESRIYYKKFTVSYNYFKFRHT